MASRNQPWLFSVFLRPRRRRHRPPLRRRQRRHARIFLKTFRLGITENLAQSFLGKRLENIGEETALLRLNGIRVAAERHFVVAGSEHLFIFAVRFQRRAEARKDGVRTANTVLEQCGQPFPNPLLHRRFNFSPIADARVGGARTANEMDASG
jgi:hypothetical protein